MTADEALAVIAGHADDGTFGSIDWAAVLVELGREPTDVEITHAWLTMRPNAEP